MNMVRGSQEAGCWEALEDGQMAIICPVAAVTQTSRWNFKGGEGRDRRERGRDLLFLQREVTDETRYRTSDSKLDCVGLGESRDSGLARNNSGDGEVTELPLGEQC